MTLYHDISENYMTTADGVKIRYLECAGEERPPIVLVHALAVQNSADQWLSSFDELRKHFHVYALDVPGWGLSDMPASGYTFPMWVGAVKGFVDGLGLKDINVVGQSLGGWIAALYVHQNQDNVRRLALLSNAGLNPSPPTQASTFVLPTRDRVRGLGYVTQAMADAIYDQMVRPGREEAYVQILDYINDAAVREEWGLRNFLPDMKLPILFTQADTNRAIQPQYAMEAFRLAPHGRLLITMGGSAPGGYNTPEMIATAIRFFNMDEVPVAQ